MFHAESAGVVPGAGAADLEGIGTRDVHCLCSVEVVVVGEAHASCVKTKDEYL
jgi:hypothetical protein